MKNLLKGLYISLLALVGFGMLAKAQANAYRTFVTIPVTAPFLTASPGGSASTPGASTLYYVVIANFVGGSVASNVVTVSNATSSLSSTNLIALQWTPSAGAVTYDLLKLTSTTIPTGSASTGLHTGLTVLYSTDTGSSTASYTVANAPVQSQATLDYNSRDYLTPQFEIGDPNGIKPGLALSTVVTNQLTNTTSAVAGAVTLTAAQITNGLFTHSPAGDVSDVTPNATAIVGALQSCTASATNGTRFTFALFNTAAGANTITLTAGSGVTIVGTATVAQNAVRRFQGIVTACTGTPTVKLYSLGTGAF